MTFKPLASTLEGGVERIFKLQILAFSLLRNNNARAQKALYSADDSLGECSICQRKTWTKAELGAPCLLRQPGGFSCPGKFYSYPSDK